MEKCPSCKQEYPRLLAVSRKNSKIMICDKCGMMEALNSVPRHVMGPVERTRAAVMATGNKWAIENFNAAHS